MKSIVKYGSIIGGVFFLFSCVKPESVPPIPAIEFKNFIQHDSSSAELIISFKDGDGDIGLDQSDTIAPFNPSSIYYFNMYMIYYYKGNDGLFHNYILTSGDTLKNKYRIPNITPTGQNKILDGDIQVNLKAPIYVPGHEVVKFEVYIYDRELHKSNIISTSEITVP